MPPPVLATPTGHDEVAVGQVVGGRVKLSEEDKGAGR